MSTDLAPIIERLRLSTLLDHDQAAEVVHTLRAFGVTVEDLAAAEPASLLRTWQWRTLTETAALSRDDARVPKWATTETWSEERIAWAALAEALKAGARYQEAADRVEQAFVAAVTGVPSPGSDRQQRRAVAAIVADWDIRRQHVTEASHG